MDYKSLEALYTIIEHQSFEAAANALSITQSAVSQRLKALQNYYDDPLLVRELPYHPTELGAKLLSHFKRVRLLEDEFDSEFHQQSKNMKLSIAVSRDSLETWFLDVLSNKNLFSDKLIEIFTDDQEVTLDYLKKRLSPSMPFHKSGCAR